MVEAAGVDPKSTHACAGLQGRDPLLTHFGFSDSGFSFLYSIQYSDPEICKFILIFTQQSDILLPLINKWSYFVCIEK